ncbi:MAG: sulfite exporter TauE/SafE family protein, partial [Actinomycetota bacterium]
MTWLEVFGAGGGVLLAAAAQYTAGFGFSLLGVPLIALALPTHDAVIISTWLGLLTNGFQMSRGWRAADRATVGRLLSGTVLGVPLGLVVFTRVDESVLKAVLGLTVLAATALLVAVVRFRRCGSGPDWVAGVGSGAGSAALSTIGPP